MTDVDEKYNEELPILFEDRVTDQERILDTYNKFLKFFSHDEIKSNSLVLDLGSGDSSFLKACKKRNINVNDLDKSKDAINFEVDKINYEDNFFDFVCLNSVIEHIREPKLLLNEIYRILKKNGKLLIISPNCSYALQKFYHDPTHMHPYTDISIKKILTLYNFKQINVKPFLVKKSVFWWKIKFPFFFASILPFKNHEYLFLKKILPNFLWGNSTAMLCVAVK